MTHRKQAQLPILDSVLYLTCQVVIISIEIFMTNSIKAFNTLLDDRGRALSEHIYHGVPLI